ncbi:2-hydroxy-6-oxo-6-phenylhexa-2,4-dienoate hydrolase [bacterium HR23]|uniref:Carboxylesterase n=1 Tax=uncultured prokaryote TaxID=198431 RepID=H5SLG8_9ZZZZ|nr:carboxylesterase [uncultured prokaryote]GBD11790.1 2-hydroxy-6-oxo-6-phenylhexa-2,4-dienoate hydrolase [bacterium HR23]
MQLVFVHGAGGSSLSFTYQVRYFGKMADAVDLPGHPKGKPCTSVPAYAEWVRGYIWAKGYTDVVLVGHSMGGAIAQWYGLHYPEELVGLVLIGTGARLRVRPDILQMCQDAITDPVKRQEWLQMREQGLAKVPPEIKPLLLERTNQVGPAVQLNDFLCCDKFDIMDRVREIRLPTLVIVGTEDIMTPVKYADYLARNIPGAQEVVIQDATHSVALEKPEEVNRAIEEFVQRLQASRR